MDMLNLIEEYRDEKKMHCMEGSTGVENLCRLVNTMGYQDAMHRGQFAQDGCHGDLIEFLSDNPGAIEAIINWIADQNSPEWKEALESELPARKVQDCYENGECPDCKETIPADATEGEECTCGHVFCHEDD